jgi:hypothetical protein
MLASSLERRFARSSINHLKQQIARASTSKSNSGAIGPCGRHEVWRDDIYDHDNEPK